MKMQSVSAGSGSSTMGPDVTAPLAPPPLIYSTARAPAGCTSKISDRQR